MAPMPSPEPHPPSPDSALLARHGAALLAIARAAVEHGIGRGQVPAVDPGRHHADLRTARATFVTLKLAGRLRGCVGSYRAQAPLVEDVAANAYAAAFEDNRFAPLGRDELGDLDISISLLSRPERIAAASEADLLSRLRPGVDGLIIGQGRRRAVFLPEVWDMLQNPREFLAHLKAKAGFDEDYWSETMRVERFTTCSVGKSEEPAAAG